MNRNRDADEVLDVLRCGHGVVGAADLAEVLGLSLSGVRFHLGHLISTGRVRSESAPAVGRGRPRLLYRAIPAAAVEDGAAYQLLAELLAEQLFRDGRTVEQAGARWAELLLAERRPIDGVREDRVRVGTAAG
jgi:predicted ArsR family transcriptional regulator